MARSKLQPREHIESLLKTISKGLYEKDHILSVALLCAICREWQSAMASVEVPGEILSAITAVRRRSPSSGTVWQ